jgi:hypothetical protein
MFSSTVFNSRLAYHLIIDVEDYFTCNNDYKSFLIDEPDSSSSMHLIYVFNVTNAAQVLQQGFRPNLVETGPYGFTKYTYKYDIWFSDDSLSVTFKEYSILNEVTDATLCEKMYFRMERDYSIDNPCPDLECLCKSYNSTVTIINPLFLKLLWKESPFDLISHYSVDVFTEIQSILNEPFTEAVKAHLVSNAWKEIYLFRVQMQVGVLFTNAFTNLLETYSYETIANTVINPSTCGMENFGISGCLFVTNSIVSSLIGAKVDIPNSSYPYIGPLLNASNSFSFMNLDIGLPKWIGLCWYFGLADFNSNFGYTMTSKVELENVLNELVIEYAEDYFKTKNITNYMKIGTRRVVQSICNHISKTIIYPYSVVHSQLQNMAYTEFLNSTSPVACSPLGFKCVWQWGYLVEKKKVIYKINNNLEYTLIDVGSAINTNPNNLYKDLNAPSLYNTFVYCTKVYEPLEPFNLSCTNYGYTFDDALIHRPAGIWAATMGNSTVNKTDLYLKYNAQPQDIKDYYFHFSCNISILQHQIYRNATAFHDEYVVRFINKYKDPELKHNFTIGNWSELGIAQWAGGFVTQALVSVRSINQVVRDGMWRFGDDKYYNLFVEYSSWAIKQGYPQAWIYSVEDAKLLLDRLATHDQLSFEFRKQIMYKSTTYIGDGVNFIRDVGNVGDYTYTFEFNKANFSCNSDSLNAKACEVLDEFFSSSADYCVEIEAWYTNCVNFYTYYDNKCAFFFFLNFHSFLDYYRYFYVTIIVTYFYCIVCIPFFIYFIIYCILLYTVCYLIFFYIIFLCIYKKG